MPPLAPELLTDPAVAPWLRAILPQVADLARAPLTALLGTGANGAVFAIGYRPGLVAKVTLAPAEVEAVRQVLALRRRDPDALPGFPHYVGPPRHLGPVADWPDRSTRVQPHAWVIVREGVLPLTEAERARFPLHTQHPAFRQFDATPKRTALSWAGLEAEHAQDAATKKDRATHLKLYEAWLDMAATEGPYDLRPLTASLEDVAATYAPLADIRAVNLGWLRPRRGAHATLGAYDYMTRTPQPSGGLTHAARDRRLAAALARVLADG